MSLDIDIKKFDVKSITVVYANGDEIVIDVSDIDGKIESEDQWSFYDAINKLSSFDDEIYNITHNLSNMASKVILENGNTLYDYLWNGLDVKNTTIIEVLKESIIILESNPKYFNSFNAANGWGKYENLLSFIKKLLYGVSKVPTGFIKIWK